MTDTTTTQAAVDATQAPAQPGAADAGARNDGDDLDKLLNEFQEQTRAPQSTQPEQKAGTDDLKALADEVRGLRTEKQQETFRRDMDATVKTIRGDLDPEQFDDALIESYIDSRARKDPRLTEAWTNRHADQRKFQKVAEQLSREFAKKYGKLIDKGATEDRESVSAAVRGASTKAPPGSAPNYGSLTNSDFQAEKDKLFG